MEKATMQIIKFIQSQYEPGVSLREDIYKTQFSLIFFNGNSSDKQKIRIQRKFKSINESITFIEQFINGKNCNNAKFKAITVAILDRHQRNVINGEIDHSKKCVNWFYPVTNSCEIKSLREDQITLLEKAKYEYFYDESRVFGDSLTENANRLNNFLCCEKYINCDEIKTLKFKFYYPNILI